MATYISAPILCVREPGSHFSFPPTAAVARAADLCSQIRRCWWSRVVDTGTGSKASARHALFLLFSRLAFGLFGREGATRAGSTKTTSSPFGVRSLVPARRSIQLR